MTLTGGPIQSRQSFWGCEQVTFVLWWSGSGRVKDLWVVVVVGVEGAELVCVRGSLPLGQRAPGALLVCEDVDNLLL